MEGLLILAAMVGATALPMIYFTREARRLQARIKHLTPRNSIFFREGRVRVTHPSASPSKQWTRALIFASNKHLVAYPVKGDDTPLFTCLAHEIEGFWRPTKYQDGDNLIEIHAIVDGEWTLFKVKLTKTPMMALVRALKQLVNDDIVRAYRQRRPYIFRPPTPAYLAVQDIYGMWNRDESIKLYLTPATLVFLAGEEDHVLLTIKLRNIQNIRVLKPTDDANDDGLLAFSLSDTKEEVAIAIDHTDSWAQSIANAAKRTLEAPITRKQKGKSDDEMLDDDSYDDDAFDMALWETMDYVLGDDGELQPRAERLAKSPKSS